MPEILDSLDSFLAPSSPPESYSCALFTAGPYTISFFILTSAQLASLSEHLLVLTWDTFGGFLG